MKGLPASSLATVPALLLAAALALPQAASARSSDRNQPMDIDAGHGDYSLDDSKPTTLTGGVTITQGSLNISASTAVMRMREQFGRRRRLSTRKSKPIISGMRWSEIITCT